MPVVNREVVLPVDRERAWELITEPAELEEWLADDVEFEAEEDAPLRVAARPRGRRRGGRPSSSGSSSAGATRASSGRSRTHPGGTRFLVTEHRYAGRHDHVGPEADGAGAASMLCPA